MICVHLISSLHLITSLYSKTRSGLVKLQCDSQMADLTPSTGDQAVAIDLDWFTTSVLQPCVRYITHKMPKLQPYVADERDNVVMIKSKIQQWLRVPIARIGC